MKYWDVSWNPVTGCSPCSPGCDNCWAKKMACRLKGRYGYPADDPFRVTFHPERLNDPLKWKKPKRIFVCDMGDFFLAPLEFQAPVLNIIHKANWHKYFFLTKRAEQMDNFQYCCGGLDAPYIWLGVTICNQQEADEKIPILLRIPAVHRWLSVEPMLGPIDFKFIRGDYKGSWLNGLDWVVLGGETGPKARPVHPDWIRLVRDQCQIAGVKFFFKQWGGRKFTRFIDGKEWNEMSNGREG